MFRNQTPDLFYATDAEIIRVCDAMAKGLCTTTSRRRGIRLPSQPEAESLIAPTAEEELELVPMF